MEKIMEKIKSFCDILFKVVFCSAIVFGFVFAMFYASMKYNQEYCETYAVVNDVETIYEDSECFIRVKDHKVPLLMYKKVMKEKE